MMVPLRRLCERSALLARAPAEMPPRRELVFFFRSRRLQVLRPLREEVLVACDSNGQMKHSNGQIRRSPMSIPVGRGRGRSPKQLRGRSPPAAPPRRARGRGVAPTHPHGIAPHNLTAATRPRGITPRNIHVAAAASPRPVRRGALVDPGSLKDIRVPSAPAARGRAPGTSARPRARPPAPRAPRGGPGRGGAGAASRPGAAAPRLSAWGPLGLFAASNAAECSSAFVLGSCPNPRRRARYGLEEGQPRLATAVLG